MALRLTEGERSAAAVRELWDEGHAVMPIDSRLPAREIEWILSVSRPHLLISGEGRIELSDSEPVPEGTAVVLSTSGTTGIPKPVELSHGALRAASAASHKRLGVTDTDRWLCCLPLNHIAGFSILVRSQLIGSDPVFVDTFDPKEIENADATLVSLVPTQLRKVLDASVDLTKFKAVLVGGAAVPPELVERAARAGVNLVRGYGMTETCGGVVYDGITLEGVHVRIGESSHVEISGPMLMTGYRGAPELTNARLRDGWFETRDLGRLEHGRLEVLGRADGVINTGAEKVLPADVEAVLADHPLVSECAVFGVPDEMWGERTVAVVVPTSGDLPTPDELRLYVKQQSAHYKVPKDVYLTAAIPRLPSGETDVASLKELLQL